MIPEGHQRPQRAVNVGNENNNNGDDSEVKYESKTSHLAAESLSAADAAADRLAGDHGIQPRAGQEVQPHLVDFWIDERAIKASDSGPYLARVNPTKSE